MPIDYTKYPPNWKSEIRPRIMSRANNTCEFDGCDFVHMEMVYSVKEPKKPTVWVRDIDAVEVSENAKIKLVKVVLTIAHLDHDENNFDVLDERLRAACQLHHLRFDAAEKQKRKNNNK